MRRLWGGRWCSRMFLILNQSYIPNHQWNQRITTTISSREEEQVLYMSTHFVLSCWGRGLPWNFVGIGTFSTCIEITFRSLLDQYYQIWDENQVWYGCIVLVPNQPISIPRYSGYVVRVNSKVVLHFFNFPCYSKYWGLCPKDVQEETRFPR